MQLSTLTPQGSAAKTPMLVDWASMRVLVVMLCFTLNMLDGTDLLIMSFIAPVLSETWQVSPERLGVLFSASLAGMAIGCLFIAPLADRWGRRSMIIAALAVVTLAMTLSGFSRGISELMILRLFVGIGVGTIGVSMTAMAAEFAPHNRTDFAVSLVQAGWPLGSIITAMVASHILPTHGWRAMLMGIGVLSAVLLAIIWRFMPESMSFLLLQRSPKALQRINTIRQHLHQSPLADLPPEPAGRARGFQIGELFKDGRALPGVLLWSAVTLSYFVLYFVISWIPKLVSQTGAPVSVAIYAGASYNLGAFFGSASIGWIAIRFGLTRVVATFLALAAAALVIFGGLSMPASLMLLVALCIGVTVQGGFNGFWAVSARLYPVAMRSTGIGWAMGVTRIGAVLGPIVGGLLVGAAVPVSTIFAIYAASILAASCLTLGIVLNR